MSIATCRLVGSDGGQPEVVWIERWNVSFWSRARLAPNASEGGLAGVSGDKAGCPLYTKGVRAALRCDGCAFHWADVRTAAELSSSHLRCSFPDHAAWRRLHAMARVHAIQVLCRLTSPAQRSLVEKLDMQLPTLLPGNFNDIVSLIATIGRVMVRNALCLRACWKTGGPFLNV